MNSVNVFDKSWKDEREADVFVMNVCCTCNIDRFSLRDMIYG